MLLSIHHSSSCEYGKWVHGQSSLQITRKKKPLAQGSLEGFLLHLVPLNGNWKPRVSNFQKKKLQYPQHKTWPRTTLLTESNPTFIQRLTSPIAFPRVLHVLTTTTKAFKEAKEQNLHQRAHLKFVFHLKRQHPTGSFPRFPEWWRTD